MMVVECLNKTETIGEMQYNYFYRLVKDAVTLTYCDEDTVVQTYGIEIERQDYLNGELVNIERDSVGTISPQRYKVHSLLKMIHERGVSPIHLIDVLGEYIDEYIIDFDMALSEIAFN